MAKIPMTILRSQNFRGVPVKTGERIETESRKVAAVLTKLGRAREIPEFEQEMTIEDAAIAVGLDLASKDDQVAIAYAVPAKRAYKKRTYKRRGPSVRK